jgi:hypothetical protein
MKIRQPRAEHRERYVRLNVSFDEPPPKLDNVDALTDLKESTIERLQGSEQIRMAAQKLAATCFYFEVTSDVTETIAYSSQDLAITGLSRRDRQVLIIANLRQAISVAASLATKYPLSANSSRSTKLMDMCPTSSYGNTEAMGKHRNRCFWTIWF